MSERIGIYNLFPQPVFKYKLKNYKEHNSNLIPYIYKMQEMDVKGENRSNSGGWHSKPFDLKEKGSVQNNFLMAVSECIFDTFLNYGWKVDPKRIRVREMWAIINKKDNFNIEHTHPNSYLSAAYYVKTPKNCGKFIASNPNLISKNYYPPIDKITQYNQKNSGIEVEEGNLLLFPAYLPHKVEKNMSNEDRIVISFNVDTI